ncbi:MAG: hypothetical protein U1G07_03825 [Verrucomicrobiota bacterium]
MGEKATGAPGEFKVLEGLVAGRIDVGIRSELKVTPLLAGLLALPVPFAPAVVLQK